jgi:outer membrane protein
VKKYPLLKLIPALAFLALAGGISQLPAQNNENDAPIPEPARRAEIAPLTTPTPFPTPAARETESLDQPLAPGPTPFPTPQPTPTPSPTPPLTSGDIPLPAAAADVGVPSQLSAGEAAPLPTPTPDPLEITLSPDALGLPDVLTDEPMIPTDLLSPIPKPPTINDQGTIRSSEDTLKKLREAAKGKEPPPAEKKLTIAEAVAFGLENNPDVQTVIERIRQTQGEFISVRAQVLPQLAANSAYSFFDQSLQGGAIAPGAPLPQNQFWSMQLGVNQLLFDSGAAISGIQAAKFVETSAYFQLRKAIDDTIAAIKINFYQIILNRALIIAQEQSVALLESQLQDQINRFEAGTVPRFNVLQAEVALANSIPPLIQARNNLRVAQFQLVRLLGMNYDLSKPIQVPFNVQGDLNVTFRLINTDESVRTALIRNPQLKAQRQDILAEAARVNVALAGYGPTISGTAGFEWQNDSRFRDAGQVLSGWFFGVQGSWNIFDGFLTAGNVQQAKARLMQSKILYDNSVRSIILQVQEAISNLQQAKETIDSQQASVEQATEALRLSRERLDAGAGTQLDVLNAQVSLLQAQTTLLQARFDYIESLAQYDAALSLDTQWEEVFDDPLAHPDKRRFIRVNAEDYTQPDLPRAFRKEDPLAEVLENSGPTYSSQNMPPKDPAQPPPSTDVRDIVAAPTPTPTPRRGP